MYDLGKGGRGGEGVQSVATAQVSHDCFRRKFILYDGLYDGCIKAWRVENVHNCVIYAVMRI